MPLNIDYNGLEMAMTWRNLLGETLHFFDTETGEVLAIDEETEQQVRLLSNPDQADNPTLRLAWYILWDDNEIGEELPEAEETAMYEQVKTYLARYAEIPQVESHESYQDMVDFAIAVSDSHLRDLLEVALNGKGAFRRFKGVLLSYPEERQRWFAFKDQRLRERIDEWLRRQEIISDERQQPE